MKKGQASTEYVVLLAVVIIVALVVVGILGGFLDIGKSADEKASKSYWRGAEIGLMDWEMAAGTNDDTLVVRNNQDYRIEITAITVESTTVDVADKKLKAGETYTFTGDWSDCTIGDSYSLGVYFTYDNDEYNVNDKNYTGAKNIDGVCK